MIELHVCPSTLAEGWSTYSPQALQMLFDGEKVSHIIPDLSPQSNDARAKMVYRQVGRISLSGVQSKFSVVVDGDHLRFAMKGEQGTFLSKPKPTVPYLYDQADSDLLTGI